MKQVENMLTRGRRLARPLGQWLGDPHSMLVCVVLVLAGPTDIHWRGCRGWLRCMGACPLCGRPTWRFRPPAWAFPNPILGILRSEPIDETFSLSVLVSVFQIKMKLFNAKYICWTWTFHGSLWKEGATQRKWNIWWFLSSMFRKMVHHREKLRVWYKYWFCLS